MQPHPKIDSATSKPMDLLCSKLAELAGTNSRQDWPREQFDACRSGGVLSWFLPKPWGSAWSETEILKGYMRLSASCMTTTFVITQFVAAARRIAACENQTLKDELLGQLSSGEKFVTVGISHLTTSHRHLARPVLTSTATDTGFLLNGFSPWVTSGSQADFVVTGAAEVDAADNPTGRQILIAVPTDSPGVSIGASNQLVSLSASQTGRVNFENVAVDRRWLLAGPIEDVLPSLSASSTGGLQTSALAIGLATAAIDFMKGQSAGRPELQSNVDAFSDQLSEVTASMFSIASGSPGCSKQDVRKQANSLAIRATQAALVAAKGAGYVEGHPVGRWCREALFFLVWSCPQEVRDANLCELAGIA